MCLEKARFRQQIAAGQKEGLAEHRTAWVTRLNSIPQVYAKHNLGRIVVSHLRRILLRAIVEARLNVGFFFKPCDGPKKAICFVHFSSLQSKLMTKIVTYFHLP